MKVRLVDLIGVLLWEGLSPPDLGRIGDLRWYDL